MGSLTGIWRYRVSQDSHRERTFFRRNWILIMMLGHFGGLFTISEHGWAPSNQCAVPTGVQFPPKIYSFYRPRLTVKSILCLFYVDMGNFGKCVVNCTLHVRDQDTGYIFIQRFTPIITTTQYLSPFRSGAVYHRLRVIAPDATPSKCTAYQDLSNYVSTERDPLCFNSLISSRQTEAWCWYRMA